ncbi:hypothetical protein MTO96_039198 [Rhipicephalus appendiculatus]
MSARRRLGTGSTPPLPKLARPEKPAKRHSGTLLVRKGKSSPISEETRIITAVRRDAGSSAAAWPVVLLLGRTVGSGKQARLLCAW